MNRIDRLFALLLYLQSRRSATAEEMAAHFELSVRTIYRDLAALGEAGVPIIAEAGVGYALMKGFHLPPVNFTTEEASALVTGAMLVGKFADASVNSHMRSALGKLRAILPRDEQDRIGRLEQNLGAMTPLDPVPQADLCLLQQAIARRRVLRLLYRGGGQSEATERTIEPLALLHYLDRWHLIAWCRLRGDYRDFRTDRMIDVAEERESFTPREPFDLQEFIRRAMPPANVEARIRFLPWAADRAEREWWMGLRAEECTAEGVVLTLAAADWDYLVRWLLSFGSAATVLDPPELKNRLVAAAHATASHHGENLS